MTIARIGTIFSLLIACSLTVYAQKMEWVSKPIRNGPLVPVVTENPLSVSFETGRYDPEPNCKKEVDGCLPKVWTSSTEFQLGSRVWVKITVLNHSDLFASEYFDVEIPAFRVDVLESATGIKPILTLEGCQLHRDDDRDRCPPIPVPKELLGIGGYGKIQPHGSNSWIVEVTRTYWLVTPGEYTVSIWSDGFNLITKDNYDVAHEGAFRDVELVKRSGELKAGGVKFIIKK